MSTLNYFFDPVHEMCSNQVMSALRGSTILTLLTYVTMRGSYSQLSQVTGDKIEQ